MSGASLFALILIAVLIACTCMFLCYYDVIIDFFEKREKKKELKRKMVKMIYSGKTYNLSPFAKSSIDNVLKKIREKYPYVDVELVLSCIVAIGVDCWDIIPDDVANNLEILLMFSDLKNSLRGGQND